MTNTPAEEFSSFKDKDAIVFRKNNSVYRKIFYSYKENYDMLINSGLYTRLTTANLLVSHTEVENEFNDVYKVIKPEEVFISYPWEWSFSQLKNAALTTIEIQKLALEYGMSLKDANCYNIQFHGTNPILIDTTSFEKYNSDEPWVAYKQFCENFLAPLALMAYTDISLNKLFLSNINGIPLELTSKLLPLKSIFNIGILCNIHLHSKVQNKYHQATSQKIKVNLSKNSQIALLNNLSDCIKKLELPNYKTEWENYYNDTNYNEKSFNHKKLIISEFEKEIKPKKVIDFGANTGLFSRMFKNSADFILALDIDPLAVEQNYKQCIKEHDNKVFPLLFDLTNPSPSIGWDCKERITLPERLSNINLVMALALIHHLRITYNIPFKKIAEYFSQFAPYLIIEFVKKDDSQIQKMLLNREDVFDDYTVENFENTFNNYYQIVHKEEIIDTQRTLYLMERIK